MADLRTPTCTVIFAVTLLHASVARAAPVPNPCAGPSALLALLDRPTVGDSGCVAPQGKTVLEAGVASGRLSSPPGGPYDNGPNVELRWGLPAQAELVWLPPNFQWQQSAALAGRPAAVESGFGASTLGIKHEFGYNAHWQWTAEGLTTLPSGNPVYGDNGFGGALNGIVSYSNGPLGASLMLGVTSQTEPTAQGGERYQSLNPDFVVTWLSTPKLQFYAEAYGQTATGFGQGWGSDADGGVQYLLNPAWEVDLEEGVQLQGNLGGFANYTGLGLGSLL